MGSGHRERCVQPIIETQSDLRTRRSPSMQQFIGVDDTAAGTSYRLGAEQHHAVGLYSQGMGLGRLGFGRPFSTEVLLRSGSTSES